MPAQLNYNILHMNQITPHLEKTTYWGAGQHVYSDIEVERESFLLSAAIVLPNA